MENILCTHAGVSVEWLANSCQVKEVEPSKIADLVNEVFQEKPNLFDHNGMDPYGDNTYQTPIWIRPASLISINRTSLEPYIVQVVGHTAVKIDIMDTHLTNGRYHFIDKLHNYWGDYLIYEDGVTTKGEIKRERVDS